jgi:hypothetical protein
MRTFVASEGQRLSRGEHLIVCVYLDAWQYFVSEPYFWLLDREKWLSNLPQENRAHQERFDMAVVDDVNAEAFLEKMAPYRRSIEELRQLLITNFDTALPWSESIGFFPSLMVNFGEKCLFSSWPESPDFEKYVPPRWLGEAREFMEEIPTGSRYWIINGNDYWANVRSKIQGA